MAVAHPWPNGEQRELFPVSEVEQKKEPTV
jgi:hypothetical protein